MRRTSPSGLQTADDPNVFALGDCSRYVCPENGAAMPPRAQMAHRQAMFFADVLARAQQQPVSRFHYRDYGLLGLFAAVGVLIGGLNGREMLIGGWTARLLYGLMYQKHVLSLHGFICMAAQSLAHWIRAKVTPSVRLH